MSISGQSAVEQLVATMPTGNLAGSSAVLSDNALNNRPELVAGTLADAAHRTGTALSGYSEARAALHAAVMDNGADVCGGPKSKDLFSLNAQDATQPSPFATALKTGLSMAAAAIAPPLAPILAVGDAIGAVKQGLNLQHASILKGPTTNSYTDVMGDTYESGFRVTGSSAEVDVTKIMAQSGGNAHGGMAPSAAYISPLQSNAEQVLKDTGSQNVLKALATKTAFEKKLVADAGLVERQALRHGYHMSEITSPRTGAGMGRV